MAVDKKSDHVGTHGGAYIDNDGMSRQFTYIDHDVKTKIAVALNSPLSELQEDMRLYREELVIKILSMHASLCPSPYIEFIIRGASLTGIVWNETMLRDPGVTTEKLVFLYNIISNKAEISKTAF